MRSPTLHCLAALALLAGAGCRHMPPATAPGAAPQGTGGIPTNTPVPPDQGRARPNNPVAPPTTKGSGQLPDSGSAHDSTARDSTARDSTRRDSTLSVHSLAPHTPNP